MGYGLKANGELWMWGSNSYGQLGDNTQNNYSSPVAVVGNHSFIGANAYTLIGGALKADGSVWSWGSNSYGGLGINEASTESKSSPVLVVGNHSFISLSRGYYVGMGLKSNGELWCWGDNEYALLGNNTMTNTSSPVTVVGNHSFIFMVPTTDKAFAIKSNGEVWSWGQGTNGNLGNNDIESYSSPVAVVGNHKFEKIASIVYGGGMALKADGSVWAWGNGNYGMNGDNTTTNRSSPVQVVGNHSFKDIFCTPGSYNMTTLKADGSAWSWGRNVWGELGDNTTTNRSSPVKVVGNHSFIKIGAFGTSGYGLKANGEMWAWGNNSLGQLGDNTSGVGASKSSPVLVVGSHSFSALGMGLSYEGSVCWGHITGVTENNVRTFTGKWTGDGTISGSGDSEKIELDSGQYMESENWNTGIGNVKIGVNVYQSGGNVTVEYKTAATEGDLSSASYAAAPPVISSLGWVKLKVSA